MLITSDKERFNSLRNAYEDVLLFGNKSINVEKYNESIYYCINSYGMNMYLCGIIIQYNQFFRRYIMINHE
jgi:hypothetical protein